MKTKYIDFINEGKENNLPKILQDFLNKFPNDAKRWSEATDEVRDICKLAKECYNEKDLKVENSSTKAYKAMDFRSITSPSEWNIKGKEYINTLYNKMSEETKKYFLEEFKQMFSINENKVDYIKKFNISKVESGEKIQKALDNGLITDDEYDNLVLIYAALEKSNIVLAKSEISKLDPKLKIYAPEISVNTVTGTVSVEFEMDSDLIDEDTMISYIKKTLSSKLKGEEDTLKFSPITNSYKFDKK